jgi:hypothetical protein
MLVTEAEDADVPVGPRVFGLGDRLDCLDQLTSRPKRGGLGDVFDYSVSAAVNA